MVIKSVLEQYNSVIRITKGSPRQKRLFASEPDVIASDTETTGLIFNSPSVLHTDVADLNHHNPFPFGLSFAFRYRQKIVLVWARWGTKLWPRALALLKTSITKTWHNARYDLRVCKENDIKVSGAQHCTLTMARIFLDRRRHHALQKLSEFLWPELSAWEVDLKKEWTKLQTRYTRAGHEPGYTNYSFLPDALIGPYSMTDSFIGLMLFEKLHPIMMRDFLELYERELEVMHAISKIECRGLAWDIKKAKRETRRLKKPMDAAEDTLKVYSGPDKAVSYWQTVRDTLYSLGITPKQLTVKKQGVTKITTDADKLNDLLRTTKRKRVQTYIETLLTYRAYKKTISTYLLPLTKIAEINNGIVYTSINPADTVTGRMASRDPNLHNIPTLNPRRGRTSGGENPVRSCFICRKGCVNYYFDQSQMEIAFFGLLANEPLILETYAAGGDIHAVMADTLYGKDHTEIERDRTKDTNYGIIYGMGIIGMAKARGVSIDEAKEFLRMYHRTFPSINAFLDECKFQLRYQGYVEDYFGKRYHVPLNQAYKAVNCLVQGGCASTFKVGLLAVVDMLKECHCPANILLPVHDEIIIEQKKYQGYPERQFCQDVVHCMTEIPVLLDRGLRLRVDVKKSTTSWAEKVPVKI